MSELTVAETKVYIEKERRLVDELRHFAGRWVAVRDHEIIADAPSAKELDEQLAGEEPPYRTFRVSRAPGATLL